MKKKKNNKIFWFILCSLFVVYMGLYIANAAGYYESKLNDRVKLTNESIKKFEQDISEGKDVSIDDYLKKENKDYSNKASKLGLSISQETEKIMNNTLAQVFKVLNKLFT